MQNWRLMRDGKMDKEAFILRAQILDLIRAWFKREGFLEVETPSIVKHPDLAPDLDLFATEFVSKDGKVRERRYLQTSPEYDMKKLLGAGFEKIFQVSKSFRNAEWVADGSSTNRHNPEFTMLEWYRAGADYRDMMSDTEKMIKYVVHELGQNSFFSFRPSVEESLSQNPPQGISPLQPQQVRLSVEMTKGEWEQLSVREAYEKHAGMNLDELRDEKDLRAAVEKKGYQLSADYSWDDLFFLVMLNEIEPKLGFERPVFLYDYPASQAALAKKKVEDSFWAERFELYIHGVELCNAFSELADPVEQRGRFEGERELRAKMGKEAIRLDEDLLEALKTMPPSGGNALGVDRLVMVLLGKKSIEEVLLFPWR